MLLFYVTAIALNKKTTGIHSYLLTIKPPFFEDPG